MPHTDSSSGASAPGSGSPGSPREGLRDWIRSAWRFAADRNDFRSGEKGDPRELAPPQRGEG
uniref:Uncharacterized protein n=1 Tax=Terrapene triunguis TaxID=2587831 RepID=A0A674IC75_9SAUR